MSGAESFRSASAEVYDRHVGRYARELAPALIDYAGIEAGMDALDVGCGPGALTSALARRLGAGRVSAIDPSESFVEACRARVPGATVVVGAAERLPFDDGSFDAALSQLVVNFMAEPEAGVREMARVTRPGGVVASCVWDYSGGMTLLSCFWAAARDVDAPGAADADESSMPWCREGELGELWRLAGLADVRTDALEVRARYESLDDLWAPFLAGIGPAGALCAALDPPRQDELRDALGARLGVGDGRRPFELAARAWTAAGTPG